MNRQTSNLTLEPSAKEAPRGNKGPGGVNGKMDIHLRAASNVDAIFFLRQSFFAVRFCQENSVNRGKAAAGKGERSHHDTASGKNNGRVQSRKVQGRRLFSEMTQ